MKIKILLLYVGLSFTCFFSAIAQDNYNESEQQNTILMGDLLSTDQATDNNSVLKKYAVGGNFMALPTRLGVGAKFSYNSTKKKRWSFDVNYFFYKAEDFLYLISPSGETRKEYYGRQFDFNINRNIIYGKRNFHFYFIYGLYFAYGNRWIDYEGLGDTDYYDEEGNAWHGNFVIIDGKRYYREEIIEASKISMGFNLGFGFEYQVSDVIRINLEQHLSLLLLSAFEVKFGVAYCF